MKIQERLLQVRREPRERTHSTAIFEEADVETAKRVSDVVREWARSYPVVLPRRIVPITLACATMCRGADDEIVASAVKVGLLICAVDDLADGVIGRLSDEQCHSMLSSLARLASEPERAESVALEARSRFSRGELPPTQQVALLLGDVCRGFATGVSTALYGIFVRHFEDCMRGMQTEREWRTRFLRDRSDVPQFDPYMQTAEKTIACGVMWTALLSIDVPRSEVPLASLPVERIEEVIAAGSRCVRVANDLRGHEREVHLEGNPNGLWVLIRHDGITEEQANERLQRLGSDAYGEMLNAASRLPEPLIEWGHRVRRFCESTTKWYSLAEFHHLPPELAGLFASGA